VKFIPRINERKRGIRQPFQQSRFRFDVLLIIIIIIIKF